MRVRIKNVDRFKDRHGKIRLYYRAGKGPRVPLRGPEGSPEFWEDYHEAADGKLKPKPVRKRAEPGTTRWLIEQYYASSMFKQLNVRTQIVRRGILDRFSEQHGEKRYAHLQPRHLRKIRDGMIDRPEAANGLLKALRQVFKCAIEYDHVDTNPVTVVAYLKSNNPEGFHAWTLEEVEQFEATHPIGTKARLALALLLYTGQRRSDIVLLGRQHVRDGWLTLTQVKGRTRKPKTISIPVLAELQRILEASPTGDLTFIVTEFNKPFTAAGFGNRFRKWCDEAGLKQCSAHGLRKAMAARLAELGCSSHEIMSIGGWDTLKEVERYTKSAEQKRLAGRVRDRIDGQNRNKKSQTLSKSLGETRNNKTNSNG